MFGLIRISTHVKRMNRLHLEWADASRLQTREFVDLILGLSPERLEELQRDLRQARESVK